MLTLKNLNHRYHKNSPMALSIPELSIEKGESIFLHGPSGSGKSTFLNILSGIISPSEGNIHYHETDFTKLSASGRDRFRGDHIGQVFQQFNLVHFLNAKENILLPLKFSPLRKKKFQKAELERFIEIFRIGHLLKKNVTQLSLGEQQRVAILRALVGSPEWIFFDEPTSALDESNTQAIMELLQQVQSATQATFLFVSHDSRLKSYFQREVSLKDISLHKNT